MEITWINAASVMLLRFITINLITIYHDVGIVWMIPTPIREYVHRGVGMFTEKIGIAETDVAHLGIRLRNLI